MELPQILQKIKQCLDKLYSENPSLFELIKNKTQCERCLSFRFAHYVQEAFLLPYFVDCDYNSHMENGQRFSGKPIQNMDGTITNRLIDIIVHKRNNDENADFICFEIKRWDNYFGRNKDRNNLRELTTTYRYKFGFHVILGKTRNKTKIIIFQNGEEIQTN
jgi:hypothetical protein